MWLDILWGALALASLIIAGSVFLAAYQLTLTLKAVRQITLPQANLLLSDVQKSLDRVEVLTQDVTTTVDEANQVIHNANRAVAALESGVESVKARAESAQISAKAGWAGVKTAMRTLLGGPPRVEIEPAIAAPAVILDRAGAVRPAP